MHARARARVRALEVVVMGGGRGEVCMYVCCAGPRTPVGTFRAHTLASKRKANPDVHAHSSVHAHA